MNYERIIIAGLVMAMLLFISCSSREVSSSSIESPVKAQVKEGAKVTVKEVWEDKWEETLKTAKKEGKVVVYSTTGGDMRDVVGRSLKGKYGIGLDFLSAKGAQIAEKIATERRAGLYIPDVWLGGATSAVTFFKPKGYLVPLEPALILPEVKDPLVWQAGEFPWIDRDHTIVGFIDRANIPLAINTNLVKPEEITSYRDLLKPIWKGKLVMNDVTMTGPGGSWFSSMQLVLGLEFMRELAKQEPVIITDWRLQLEWLAKGKYSMLVGPNAAALAEFTSAGAPIKGITPVEGSYRNTGPGNLALFKGAPNSDAAKLFINWLLSKEGQGVYGQVMGLPSARLDVPPEGVNPLAIVDPNLKYIRADSEEMMLKESENWELAKEIFGHLKK